LQHPATHCNTGDERTTQHKATDACNTLQHTATPCNTLQHPAPHCNTLQHTATHCNTGEERATASEVVRADKKKDRQAVFVAPKEKKRKLATEDDEPVSVKASKSALAGFFLSLSFPPLCFGFDSHTIFF